VLPGAADAPHPGVAARFVRLSAREQARAHELALASVRVAARGEGDGGEPGDDRLSGAGGAHEGMIRPGRDLIQGTGLSPLVGLALACPPRGGGPLREDLLVEFRLYHDFRGTFRERMAHPLILDMASTTST
jgi:hypothetical protein